MVAEPAAARPPPVTLSPKISAASCARSLRIATGTMASVWPATKVTVPVRPAKSRLPAVPLNVL